MNIFIKGKDLKRTEMIHMYTLRAFIICVLNSFDHLIIILANKFTVK